MEKIILIAPIMEVYHSAKKLIEEKSYKNIALYCGTMEKGLAIAKESEALGAEVIISRGGTYQLIQEHLHIPVVEIRGNTYDILHSLQGVEQGKRIGVIGYERLIRGIDELSQFLNFDFVKIEMNHDMNVKDLVAKYRKSGIDLFIGDSNVNDMAKALDTHGILINSSIQSISDAIDEAQNIIALNHVISQKAQELNATISYAHEGIIAVNQKEMITNFNRVAEEILNISAKDAIGKHISTVISNSHLPEVVRSRKSEIGAIQDINGIKIYTNRVPVLLDGELIGAIATFQKVEDLQKSEIYVRKKLSERGFLAKYRFQDMIYQSEEMKKVIHQAEEYAKYDAPVHIQGETGTGKELFAQSIHNLSTIRQGPFIGLNCAALAPTLIESELFGYAGGSFTGAKQRGKVGVFELAHNGTLFLDEITEIPLRLQGRLLRVLQENEIMRVGGDSIIPVHVRIITASNKNLWEEVKRGRFRKDLYFRINILQLNIPPLHKRKEDILLLANHFIRKYCRLYHKGPLHLSEEIKAVLTTHSYEGNVRELENFMQRAVILGSFDFLKEQTLQKFDDSSSLQTLSELEMEYIQKIYHMTQQDVGKTCEILKISRTTLWRKLNMVPN